MVHWDMARDPKQYSEEANRLADADPLRDYLRQRGCWEGLVIGGLEGLVERWEGAVDFLDREERRGYWTQPDTGQGYPHGMDEYVNSLDRRQLLTEVLARATDAQRAAVAERIARADAHFRALTHASAGCVLPPRIAEEYGYTWERNWWYYRVPNGTPDWSRNHPEEDDWTLLERSVMHLLLDGDDPVLAVLRAQFHAATLKSREMTGVGFYTAFNVPLDIPRLAGPPRFCFGDVEADIPPNQHGAGFLLWVMDGAIADLEGYVYDDPWPEHIESFTISYIDGTRDVKALWTEVAAGFGPIVLP